MKSTELKTDDSTMESAQTVDQQPPLVAISEENLAALLRATSAPAEPPKIAEPLAPAIEAPVAKAATPPEVPVGKPNPAVGTLAPPPAPSSAPSPTSSPASSPAPSRESRLALFAAVKENRSAMLKSGASSTAPPMDLAPAENLETIPVPALQATPLPKSVTPTATLPVPRPLIPSSKPPVDAPSATAAVAGPRQNFLQNRLAIGLALGGVLAIVGASIFWSRTRAPKAPAPPLTQAATAPKNNFALELLGEPLATGLINVRWNPQSTVIAQARDGRLVITERDRQPRILPLDADQLKTGHVAYQSAADRVQFSLEVADRSGTSVKESVMVLALPATSPQRTSASPQIPPQTPPQQSTAVPQPIASPLPQAVPNLAAPAAPSPSSQPPARAFVLPVPQPIRRRDILDAPPPLPDTPASTSPLPLPVSMPTLAPPAVVAAPTQTKQRTSSLQGGGLIKNVSPIYPHYAKAAGIHGAVHFTATVGKDGRIQGLKLLSGPPALIDSASTAVKQWIYRPTLLNGEPIEVVVQIAVDFK
ncbi:MAG: energy transducer TonB [Acidobacteriota bacterium]